MKTLALMICLTLTVLAARGQTVNSPGNANPVTLPAPTAYHEIERGANHKIWQRETYEPGPNGQVVTHIHQYTELASGMNYLDTNNQWMAAQELIEGFAGGAIAQQGQQQVIFANNLNSAGAIDVQTVDGKRLRSNVLGLMYVDPTTGQAVQIAAIQDSQGELIASNQVLYPDAFNGVKADVQYTYRLDGLEQDVILREQPPAPEAYGMDSATAQLEVFTEFEDPPQAEVNAIDASSADQAISWGATSLGHGRAFSLDGGEAPATVFKNYSTVNGRHFLLERVNYRDIKQALTKLPQQASNAHPLPGLASKNLVWPPALRTKAAAKPIQLALSRPTDHGYVLDYVTLSASYTNYTFQADTTYYISGSLDLFGTNTFEGGTVVKYATNALILVETTITPKLLFKTDVYRPAIFTAKDDNTVGEAISGSTGTPSGYYANPVLNMPSAGTQLLSGFRIMYANEGLVFAGTTPTLYDAQFVNCRGGISVIGGTATLRNALFSGVKTNFNSLLSGNLDVQNSTFDSNACLAASQFTPGPINSLYFTNCIFANVTYLTNNPSTFQIVGGYNGFYNAPVFGSSTVSASSLPFRTAGAASHYLATNSIFLNAGTTNIDSTLLDLLEGETTYPPIIYSNVTLSAATTFSPQAQRDTDIPDLGYHYDPLDYVFGGVHVHSNLVFTAGTAVGWFELPGSGGPGYGLGLNLGINVAFTGTAMAPCYFVRYSLVQEGGNGLWKDKGWLGGIANVDSYSASNIPGIIARFTHFGKPASDSNSYRDGASGQPIGLQATDCEFLNPSGGYNLQLAFTNCLFERSGGGASTSATYPYETYINCTFHGGNLTFGHSEGSAPYWYSSIYNCAFDGTTFAIDDPFGVNTNYANYDFNSFLYGAVQPPTEGAHTIIVTNGYNWQSSWFGNYYLPTNSPIIDKGSTTADQLGLYQFTTQTNQVKETTSTVDIGYHYVATDAYGNPTDTNGDGIQDYQEDANGNGIYDLNDTANWLVPIDALVPAAWYGAHGLDSGNPLIGIQDADWDGLLNQQEYLYGTDPQVSEGFSIWIGSVNGTTVIP